MFFLFICFICFTLNTELQDNERWLLLGVSDFRLCSFVTLMHCVLRRSKEKNQGASRLANQCSPWKWPLNGVVLVHTAHFLTECGGSTVLCGVNTSLNRVGTAEYRGFCTEHGMNMVLLAVEPRSTALSVRICAAWLRCSLPISGSVRQKHEMVADGTRCHYGHSRKHRGSGGDRLPGAIIWSWW